MDVSRRDKSRIDDLISRNPSLIVIDASTFQKQLEELSVAITLLLEREGVHLFGHGYLSVDIAMILRQMTYTYDLLLFLNSDDTRGKNSGYRTGYSFVVLPVVRSMIDGLYNITALLDEPRRAKSFRVSGYYRKLEALKEEEAVHGKNPKWNNYFDEQRFACRAGMAADNILEADLADSKNKWPLLNSYLDENPKVTAHKTMLRQFLHGIWKEYSNISHATFSGLAEIAPYISKDNFSLEKRDHVEDLADQNITLHIGRAAGVLISVVTEIQFRYKFLGHNIDSRILAVWEALRKLPQIENLFTSYYQNILVKPKGRL